MSRSGRPPQGAGRLTTGQTPSEKRVAAAAFTERCAGVGSRFGRPLDTMSIKHQSFADAIWALVTPGMLADPDEMSDEEVTWVLRNIRTAFDFLRCADPRRPYPTDLQAALAELERLYPCIPENYIWWFGEEGFDDGSPPVVA